MTQENSNVFFDCDTFSREEKVAVSIINIDVPKQCQL